jgi:type I restriction enzyme S subunit
VNKYRLERGDILFTEGGDRDKLGRGTVWRNEIEGCIHQNHVYRARLHNPKILPEYISLAAKTEYAKDYFFRNASQTVNLASINITTLGNLPLPIPPVEEQQEICDTVHKLFRAGDSIQADQDNLLSHLDRLNQSILAKAFRGELVEQDPNDEPASVLLDRIRAEREAQQPTKKPRGKGTGRKKTE